MKNKINQIKADKNAVILAHYYTPSAVQKIADYVGDSFYLAKIAKESKADTIVFCGVSFMGESAKILNPQKKILMPDITADCPMAHMVKKGLIEEMRSKFEDLAVVCYINSTAELKSKSDVCVTSSNAVKIVKALPNKNIFFIPDKNLGRFVANQVPEKNIILNDGCCPIHIDVLPKQITVLKELYPDALVLSHPECSDEILNLSDFIGSTAEIISFAKSNPAKEFIIATEIGVLYRLQEENPDKKFYFPEPLPCCKGMKLNTVERVLNVLENENNTVTLSEEACKKALAPLNKMLDLAR